MNIALIGYGKMGHIVEQVSLGRGHTIVCRIDEANQQDFASPAFRSAQVAIEFSAPAAAKDNILRAWGEGVSVVSGTTGWDHTSLLQHPVLQQLGWIWSSNFSLGVNLLFALNRQLAEWMKAYPAYAPSITETHHIHKLDKPSGTAKTLAEQISPSVPIESIREGEVPGIHTVRWASDVDELSISHSAKSREGFALGAVLAAEWLNGKPGFHTMNEVLFGK